MKTFKNLNTVPKRNPIQEAGSANGSETFPKAANDSENVPEDAHTYFLADFSAWGMDTGPVTEKERRNRNSDAAFRTNF